MEDSVARLCAQSRLAHIPTPGAIGCDADKSANSVVPQAPKAILRFNTSSRALSTSFPEPDFRDLRVAYSPVPPDDAVPTTTTTTTTTPLLLLHTTNLGTISIKLVSVEPPRYTSYTGRHRTSKPGGARTVVNGQEQ